MSTKLSGPFGYGERDEGGDAAWLALGTIGEFMKKRGDKEGVIAVEMVRDYLNDIEARYYTLRKTAIQVAEDVGYQTEKKSSSQGSLK